MFSALALPKLITSAVHILGMLVSQAKLSCCAASACCPKAHRVGPAIEASQASLPEVSSGKIVYALVQLRNGVPAFAAAYPQ